MKNPRKPIAYAGSEDFLWQGHKGSNSGHAVLETAALPTELYPCILLSQKVLCSKTEIQPYDGVVRTAPNSGTR